MSATIIDDQRRTTLPESICEAVGLHANDKVEWRVEQGEIRGRKLGGEAPTEEFPPGSLLEYITPEWNDEISKIASSCLRGPLKQE
jgi:hypothetical protein